MWLPETNITGPKGDKGDQGLPGEGLVTFADTPPDKQHGSLWVESDTGLMYARYNDGTSEQWIAVSGATSGGPMGPVGAQGPKGDTGSQGPQGPQGEASTVPGPQGPKGDTGPQGPLGPQGNIGPQGVKGDTGSQGPKGDQGAAGPIGPTGLTGPQGPIGLTGADSTVPGPVGPQGIQGIQGPQGETGADSVVPGPQGPQGIQGVKGDTGAQGIQGVKGDTGAQGIQGVKGDKGDKGDQGIQGPQGIQGVPGEMTQANADLRYVNVTGDSMSGDLTIAKLSPAVTLNDTGSGTPGIYGQANGSTRWLMQLGGATARDFYITRYNDSGVAVEHPLSIVRADGTVKIAQALLVGPSAISAYGDVGAARISAPTTGTYGFGNTTSKVLHFDGTNFNFYGGNLNVANGNYIRCGPSGAATNPSYLALDGGGTATTGGSYINFAKNGAVQFYAGCESAITGGATQAFCVYSAGYGTAFRIDWTGDALLNRNATVTYNLAVGGITSSANYHQGGGYMSRNGVSGGYGGHIWNFSWWDSPTGLKCYIGTVDVGYVGGLSDYRIKKDVIDLPGMWDTVKALRPIKYTQAEFQPPAHKAYLAKEALKARLETEKNPEAEPSAISTRPMFEADDIERWGFIAHELQETLVPSASSGVKDQPDAVQQPNPWTVIAALTKALQEAMLRIEALEAQSGV